MEFEIDGKPVILDDSFKLYESGTGLNTQFLDFFIHVFNLVHFVKEGSLPPIKFPDSSILKQVYSLKNLESDFIDCNYLDVLLYSKITCYILNNKLGHIEFKSVTNKLSLIPIVYYVIIKEGKLTIKEIDKISTFFWITLFSGKYSKDQNEQSIRDCENVYKFVSENEISYLNELLENDFFKIKDFATETSLCDMTVGEKVNLNAENNLVNYLLSKSLNDFCHPSKMIDINSDIIELHHIIPLASVKTVGSSTKQIRNGKHILNSVMNLTPISKDSNRAISSIEIKKYQTELSDVTISTHHLSNEWRSIQFDGSNNSDIIRLFKNRFQNINSQMLRDFNKIISQ